MAKGRGGACATARAPREEPGSPPAAPSEGPGASAGKPAARGCGPGSRGRGVAGGRPVCGPTRPRGARCAAGAPGAFGRVARGGPRARGGQHHGQQPRGQGTCGSLGRGRGAGDRAGRSGSRGGPGWQNGGGSSRAPRCPLTRRGRSAGLTGCGGCGRAPPTDQIRPRAPALRRRRASRAGAEPEAGAGPAPLHQFPEGVKTIHAHSKPRKQLKGYAEQNVAPFSS